MLRATVWLLPAAFGALLLMLAAGQNSADAALIFNVGLPRTGTSSFHYAMASLNLSSQHVAFNVSRCVVALHGSRAQLDTPSETRPRPWIVTKCARASQPCAPTLTIT
jgi:hypothetical protein